MRIASSLCSHACVPAMLRCLCFHTAYSVHNFKHFLILFLSLPFSMFCIFLDSLVTLSYFVSFHFILFLFFCIVLFSLFFIFLFIFFFFGGVGKGHNNCRLDVAIRQHTLFFSRKPTFDAPTSDQS